MTDNTIGQRGAGKLLLGALALALALWGGEYARRGLWEPDEARFAYVAREMMRDGHWAVPHRHGVEYAHKPPLLFWVTRAAARLTGGDVTPVSARAASFAGAVLALWGPGSSPCAGATARPRGAPSRCWPRRICSGARAAWGAWTPCCAGCSWPACTGCSAYRRRPGAVARAARLCLLGAGDPGEGAGRAGRAAAGVPGVRVGRRRLARAAAGPSRVGHPAGARIPGGMAGRGLGGGGSAAYFRELFLKQNIDRVTGAGAFGKPRAIYFYLGRFPMEFMPWTLVLPAALRVPGREFATPAPSAASWRGGWRCSCSSRP